MSDFSVVVRKAFAVSGERSDVTPTTSGTFRVLDSPRADDERLLIDVETHDPTYVESVEHDADLQPGYLLDATLEWVDDEPRLTDVSVRERTLFEFADDVTNLFEAARDACADARLEGVASDVTQGTDGDVNGALYAFAEQSGAADLFEEFRTGVRPLEPLVERAGEGAEGPHEVFVLRPADEPCIVVYIVLGKESMLADTVRDTYDCPRSEPGKSSASGSDGGDQSADSLDAIDEW